MKTYLLIAWGALSIAGCSTSQLVINARSNRPVPAKANYLVMSAGEMEDIDSADRVADLTEEALVRHGYRSDTRRNADIVVVSQVSSVSTSGAEIALRPADKPARAASVTRRPEDAFMSVAAFAAGSPSGLAAPDAMGFSRGSADMGVQSERLRVTVKAASMKDWTRPEVTFETLPAVWIVTAEGVASPSQRSEFLERAIDAASAYFAQNTARPQARTLSLSPPKQQAVAVAHGEPDLTLDPLQ